MNSENNLQELINERFRTAYDELVNTDKVPSQRDFCLKVGLNEGNFNKYYKGGRKVNNLILVNMTAAYGLSAEWLLTGEGEMFKNKDAIGHKINEVNKSRFGAGSGNAAYIGSGGHQNTGTDDTCRQELEKAKAEIEEWRSKYILLLEKINKV